MAAARPRGLYYLALLEFAGGASCVALGAYYVDALDAIVKELGISAFVAPDFYVFFIAEAALGAVAMALGYWLWKGRRRAVSLTGDFSVASLVFYIGFGSYFVAQYGNYTELTAGIIGIAVALTAAVSVTRPSFRGYLEGRDGEAPVAAVS